MSVLPQHLPQHYGPLSLCPKVLLWRGLSYDTSVSFLYHFFFSFFSFFFFNATNISFTKFKLEVIATVPTKLRCLRMQRILNICTQNFQNKEIGKCESLCFLMCFCDMICFFFIRYVLRRILRRCVRFGTEKLNMPPGFIASLVSVAVDTLVSGFNHGILHIC